MDGTQSTPVPERQPTSPQSGAEQLTADGIEAKVAPAAAELSANRPKADDGMVSAQAQIASVVADEPSTLVPPAAAAAVVAQATPLAAADVDVIEPEWVKKAEEAVAANREDPRAEENAVEAIQIEYLKKRYDLDVKSGQESGQEMGQEIGQEMGKETSQDKRKVKP